MSTRLVTICPATTAPTLNTSATTAYTDHTSASCCNIRIKMTEKPMGRPRKNPVQVDEAGREFVEATVKTQGKTSGGVYLPAAWVGRRVRVTLIE